MPSPATVRDLERVRHITDAVPPSPAWSVLELLRGEPDGLTARDLEARLDTNGKAVGELLRPLMRAGLVELQHRGSRPPRYRALGQAAGEA